MRASLAVLAAFHCGYNSLEQNSRLPTQTASHPPPPTPCQVLPSPLGWCALGSSPSRPPRSGPLCHQWTAARATREVS